MKVSEVQKLGLRKKTLDDMEVDIGDVITSDEFNRPTPIGVRLGTDKPKDYRHAAIEKLIDLKVPFHSNQNIVSGLFRTHVNVNCPHCGFRMDFVCCGGDSHGSTINYNCTNEGCRTTVHLSVPHDGFGVTPHEA